MNSARKDDAERVMALLAWEAANERLREALRPPEGFPEADAASVNAAFANAAARLQILRAQFAVDWGPGEVPPHSASPQSTARH